MSTVAAKHVQVDDVITYRNQPYLVLHVDPFEPGRREFTLAPGHRRTEEMRGIEMGEVKMTVPNDMRIEMQRVSW
jgi:hypothetical protein